MITIITGTPGAGKTLYTIEKLLLPQIGKTIKGRDEQGAEVLHERKIYTNINGLQIDHDLIDGGDNEGLRDWHKWAKPGSLIVFDEVQKVWPPRPNGSKIPEDVQALDTHRHMGVDFVLITQNVLNVDRHIHALGGRHLHVRRVGNMPLATVYEWDHVSRGLLYSKSITKSPWKYSRKVFKLYKSSELHTKQPRKIPTLVWFVLAGLGALVYLTPGVMDRIGSRIAGKSQTEAAKQTDAKQVDMAASVGHAVAESGAAAAVKNVVVDERVDFMPRLSDRPWTAPAYDGLRTVVRMPLIDGAMGNNKKGWQCFSEGERVEISSEGCKAWAEANAFNPYRQAVQYPQDRAEGMPKPAEQNQVVAASNGPAAVEQDSYSQGLAARNAQVRSVLTK